MVATHARLANSPEGCIQVRKLVQTVIHHGRARGDLVGQSVDLICAKQDGFRKEGEKDEKMHKLAS